MSTRSIFPMAADLEFSAAGYSGWLQIRLTCGFFFFFQAEDGIRDKLVTGSDVCSSDLRRGVPGESLRPASVREHLIQPGAAACARRCGHPDSGGRGRDDPGDGLADVPGRRAGIPGLRSEERRVGKEWRSRWWAYHLKKK